MVSSSAAATGTNMRATMERPNQTLLLQQQQQQQQQPLRCPRCDSSNTKFCYYNNYSLSQPRHFCKSCKRYWTRGGTLRNVPVGGGCRKNKKVKQRQGTAMTGSDGGTVGVGADQTTSGSSVIPANGMSSMFYGLHQQPTASEVNFPFSRSSSRYDVDQQDHQLGGLRLGFSSGILNGYSGATSSKQMIQNLISSNSLLSSYNTYESSSSPAAGSLLSSRQQLHDQQKPMAVSAGCGLNFGGLMQMKQGSGEALGGLFMKDTKLEQHGGYSRICDGSQNQQQHHQGEGQSTTLVGSSSADHDQSLFWNGTTIGSWLDPSNNMGSSSISSLI